MAAVEPAPARHGQSVVYVAAPGGSMDDQDKRARGQAVTMPSAQIRGLVAADDPMGHVQWACFPQQSPHFFPGQSHILVHVLREDVKKEIESSLGIEAAVLARIVLHHFPLLAEESTSGGQSPFRHSPHGKGNHSQNCGRRLQTSLTFSCSPSPERGRNHQLKSDCHLSEPHCPGLRVSPHADPRLIKLTSFERGC